MTITKSAFLDFICNTAEIAVCEIIENEGSSPREVGAWMLIKASGKTLGTIGGGQLEYGVIRHVQEKNWQSKIEFQMEIKLGPEIGQCCGGKVLVAIKRFSPKLKARFLSRIEREYSKFPEVLIFGAGHIGVSLANQLEHLPLKVTLIDNRENHIINLAGNFKKKFSLLPEQEIRDANPNSAFIIVTHDHSLDFMLCYEAILRTDVAYLGMIGSKTKKGVLMNWLSKKGIKDCSKIKLPIGNTFFVSKDKRPEIISAHIISEILFNLETHNQLIKNPKLGSLDQK